MGERIPTEVLGRFLADIVGQVLVTTCLEPTAGLSLYFGASPKATMGIRVVFDYDARITIGGWGETEEGRRIVDRELEATSRGRIA